MNNIILIGMPAAGKSTVGVLLAKAAGMSFFDTDLLIQQSEARILPQIIEDDGLDVFLQKEEDAVLSLHVSDSVIATGGSVVYSKEGMDFFKKIGTIYYLKVDYDEIENRISNMRTRGVVVKEGQNMHDLYNEREPLYMQYADHVIDCTLMDMEEVVYTIIGLMD